MFHLRLEGRPVSQWMPHPCDPAKAPARRENSFACGSEHPLIYLLLLLLQEGPVHTQRDPVPPLPFDATHSLPHHTQIGSKAAATPQPVGYSKMFTKTWTQLLLSDPWHVALTLPLPPTTCPESLGSPTSYREKWSSLSPERSVRPLLLAPQAVSPCLFHSWVFALNLANSRGTSIGLWSRRFWGQEFLEQMSTARPTMG